MNWETANKLEKEWWGTCCNTLGEELKQISYADRMGIEFESRNGVPFIIDLHGKTVVDIGGGPNSLLLKAVNGKGIVIDPCDYPKWVEDRYWMANIEHLKIPGEEIDDELLKKADEVWIYNVLQHVKDPELIVKKAKQAKVIRIFEWIDAETNEMHPHTLKSDKLDEWLGGKGQVEQLNGENECFGTSYYGTF
jgi:2-polyprenyl-3-methyl-5-hydroxy-6-metoxy-1,4-benzoquinol methylase